MNRKLVWIEQQRFRGFGCSECAWVFKPSGALANLSMKSRRTLSCSATGNLHYMFAPMAQERRAEIAKTLNNLDCRTSQRGGQYAPCSLGSHRSHPA